jgi:hypothetical protein
MVPASGSPAGLGVILGGFFPDPSQPGELLIPAATRLVLSPLYVRAHLSQFLKLNLQGVLGIRERTLGRVEPGAIGRGSGLRLLGSAPRLLAGRALRRLGAEHRGDIAAGLLDDLAGVREGLCFQRWILDQGGVTGRE